MNFDRSVFNSTLAFLPSHGVDTCDEIGVFWGTIFVHGGQKSADHDFLRARHCESTRLLGRVVNGFIGEHFAASTLQQEQSLFEAGHRKMPHPVEAAGPM